MTFRAFFFCNFEFSASGLSGHGLDSENPLPYTYIDIAGSAVEGTDYQYGKPTACCVVALTAKFVEPRLKLPVPINKTLFV